MDIPEHVRAMTEAVRTSVDQKTILQTTSEQQQPPLPYVPTFSWGTYWHGIGIMFLLLGLLWFLLRLVKRYGRFPFLPRQDSLPKDAFYLESQLPIGPKKSLVVVRFLDKRMLLGVTDQHITVLTEERVDDGECEVDFEAYMEGMEEKQKEHPR